MKYLLAALFLSCGLVSLPGTAATSGPAAGAAVAARTRVVFQVSDNDQAKWNLTLNNVKNIQTALGADNVDIEIVAYGPGISMLKFDTPVGNRIQDAVKSKVKVAACENTMEAQKLHKEDMVPAISYVPAGVVEIIKLQQQGYAYIRP
ncbi:DsrE family protein [Undibacterium sp.]|jgi:intracellular sulfur oxidation DsrE/DsrF family protein|uniref:DsrE family protein n=1 Tax=Undibacterium sp. TaxID=1914977 RepID=UPI002D0AF490|nr:DsrE family protein [Undibacterium sp.]HTD04197.1 DsrE family protein [Undibacterium sp.]